MDHMSDDGCRVLPDGTVIYPNIVMGKSREPRRTVCTEMSPTDLIVLITWDDECVISQRTSGIHDALDSGWITVRAYGTSRDFTLRTDRVTMLVDVRGIEEARALASFYTPIRGSDCAQLTAGAQAKEGGFDPSEFLMDRDRTAYRTNPQ